MTLNVKAKVFWRKSQRGREGKDKKANAPTPNAPTTKKPNGRKLKAAHRGTENKGQKQPPLPPPPRWGGQKKLYIGGIDFFGTVTFQQGSFQQSPPIDKSRYIVYH